ncbi:hypothetical protein Sjap_021962 [Stephania japonica]|uniref:Uncharacterized protein n=1 Tax=Stephania japonica TaxID=461633 RepID=A0AAP0HUL2_9MAGN
MIALFREPQSSTAITLFKQVKGCLCAIPDDPPDLAVILQVLTGRGVVNLDFHALDQLIQMAKDVMGKGGLSDFMDPQLLKHK